MTTSTVSARKRVEDEALVLRSRDWSETSQVCTLLTRNHGKVQIIAKGSRRSVARFGAPIEPLVRAHVCYVGRASGGLSDLRTFKPVSLHFQIRRELDRTFAASYVLELADGLSVHDQPSTGLFDHATASLEDIEGGAHFTLRVMRFELDALEASGLALCLRTCAGCDRPLASSPSTRTRLGLAPWLGGAICYRCLPSTRGAAPLPSRTLTALRKIADFEHRSFWTERRASWPPSLVNDVRRTLNLAITSALERPPRLAAYLCGSRPPYLKSGRSLRARS